VGFLDAASLLVVLDSGVLLGKALFGGFVTGSLACSLFSACHFVRCILFILTIYRLDPLYSTRSGRDPMKYRINSEADCLEYLI